LGREHTEQVQRIGIPRLSTQDLPIKSLGLFQATGLVVGEGLVQL
jgi:hypothetical protein